MTSRIRPLPSQQFRDSSRVAPSPLREGGGASAPGGVLRVAVAILLRPMFPEVAP